MSGGDQLVSPMKVISIHCGTLAGGSKTEGPVAGESSGTTMLTLGKAGCR